MNTSASRGSCETLAVDAPAAWSAPRRVAFRFAATYFVVYALLNGNTAIPVAFFSDGEHVPEWYTWPIDRMVAAVGRGLRVSPSWSVVLEKDRARRSSSGAKRTGLPSCSRSAKTVFSGPTTTFAAG